MSWNREDSKERMQRSFEQMKDVDVQPLTREMDLEKLAYNQARIVSGVHVYLDVSNFEDLLKERREDTAKLRKLLRHLAVYQRQAERLLRTYDGAAVRVHFQSARLHFIVFKPYNTEEGAALERLKTAVTIVSQLQQLAGLVSGHTGITFEFEAGIDSGEAIATMNALRGNRQLLLVGDPANRAAKALTGKPGERYAEGAKPYESQLPKASDRTPLPKHFEQDVDDDIANNPESGFTITDVTAPIDYDRLGAKVARLESGVTLYGDVSGFTAYVRDAKTLDAQRKAVQYLHVLRSEMQFIVGADYDGDFIQFQGDRVQALLYEARTTGRFKSKAVEAAAALCSAIDLAKELYLELSSLDMSCGADEGKVLVARVGLRDDKEVTVLGQSVAAASGLQDEAGDGHTAISTDLWGGLEKNLQSHFEKTAGRYLADIDISKLEAKEQEAKKSAERFSERVAVSGSLSGGVSIAPAANGAGIKPARSWGE